MPSIAQVASFIPETSQAPNVMMNPANGAQVGHAIAGLGQDIEQGAQPVISFMHKVQAAKDDSSIQQAMVIRQDAAERIKQFNDTHADKSTWDDNRTSIMGKASDEIAKLNGQITPFAQKKLASMMEIHNRLDETSYKWQGVERDLKDAKSVGDAMRETAINTGNSKGLADSYDYMEKHGFINADMRLKMFTQDNQRLMFQQVVTTISQDALSVANKLNETDGTNADGSPKFKFMPELNAKSRETLYKGAVFKNSEDKRIQMDNWNTLSSQIAIGGAQPPDMDDVRNRAEFLGIKYSTAEKIFNPSTKFNPESDAKVRIALSDAKREDLLDPHNPLASKLRGEIYDAHLPPHETNEYLKKLDKLADPNSELNTPQAKAADAEVKRIDADNWRLKIYGKYEQKVEDKDAEGGWRTIVYPKALKAAQARQAESLAAVDSWLTNERAHNREPTPMDVQKFMGAYHYGDILKSVTQAVENKNDPNAAAKQWLEENPNDPRAVKVREKLGLK